MVGIHCERRVLVVVVTRWWREVKVIGIRGEWTGIVGIDVRVIDVLEIIQNVPWLCRVIGGDVATKLRFTCATLNQRYLLDIRGTLIHGIMKLTIVEADSKHSRHGCK